MKKEKDGKRVVLLVDRKIYRVIQAVLAFSPKERRLFVESLLSRLDDRERERWFRWVRNRVHPEMAWSRVERWMERRFLTNMDDSPVKVASMAFNYFKVNLSMKPFLLKMAQRVKKRVRARRRRSGADFNADG